MSQEQQPFVHLHVHSEFSLLDGLSRVKHLAARAKELNMPALALTDHGVMYGAIQFYRTCQQAGVKPILGIESYVAARGMRDKDTQLDKERCHLLLLAENQTGYQNLLRIASDSQLEGFYYRPRIDHDYLAAHAEGLIATTGCMAAEIPRAIAAGNLDKAHRLMGWYVEVFGRDRFFVELQEHSIPELTEANKTLLEMAGRYHLRCLATNDVHYTHASEAGPHDVLLCIQTSKPMNARDRLRMSDKSYYLKSHAEMAKLFGHVPGALDNSLLIAEMCQVNPEPEGYHLPLFEVPAGFTPESYLRHLCEKGLVRRYGADRPTHDVALRQRLEHELGLIHQMGFDTYFLIVWDLCEFARQSDIWWNVRGSGAGSVVAYTLGITGIDPLANGLIFERFLNPGRVSMPDIDLDYPDDRRQEMIEYTVRKYGSDKVAQIITFGTMGARAAIRDVGRVLEVPLAEVDTVARLIPAIPGKPATIENVLDPDHEFYSADLARLVKEDESVRELIETAKNLEGVARHASTHAAGVIIADRPLVEYTPLHRPTSGEGEEGMGVVTQWDMEILESLGLLKVDFLGLSTLTIMRKAAELIEQRYGVRYTMENIPYDANHVGPDPSKNPQALFDLLGRGEVLGVFQVEGAGMKRLMTEMRPQRFDHIVAAISLYRPGPMENIPEYVARMHGKKPVQYHHPDLEPILGDTYGVIVYQEQIIQIASQLAGYEPGEADMIRKAVAKKKKDLMEKHRLQFTEGAMARGFSREVCEAIWGDIEFFARYGFNRAHASDYAVITCQTAFLKAHYPVEYMTALLSVERHNTEKVAQYLADARRMGINVAPPDINLAELDFTIEGEGRQATIRYGLGAIKNAGTAAIELILQERATNGRFTSLTDLCNRVDLRRVGRRALESMAKVGVFDRWGSRPQLLDGLDRLISHSGSAREAASAGQMSLFGLFSAPQTMRVELLRLQAAVPPIDPKELLQWEKELIGVYISDHPVTRALEALQGLVTAGTADLDETMNGKNVALAGVITHVRTHSTKKGDQMAFASLEDLQGSVDLVFFPRVWKDHKDKIRADQILLVRGKVQMGAGSDGNKEGTTLLVENVQTSATVPSAADEEPPPAILEPAVNGQRNGAARPPLMADEGRRTEDGGRPLATDRQPRPAGDGPMIEPPAADPKSKIPLPPPNFDDDWLATTTLPPELEFDLADSGRPAAPPSSQKAERNLVRDRQPGYATPVPPAASPLSLPGRGAGGEGEPDPSKIQNPKPKIVTIEVDAVGDWKETFRQSLHIALAHQGPDRLSLRLPRFGLVMDFPNHPTHFCPELVNKLQALPGVLRVYCP